MAGKNVIKEKMSHRINVETKQALAKFSNVDKSILQDHVMFFYVNDKHSILLTWYMKEYMIIYSIKVVIIYV